MIYDNNHQLLLLEEIGTQAINQIPLSIFLVFIFWLFYGYALGSLGFVGLLSKTLLSSPLCLWFNDNNRLVFSLAQLFIILCFTKLVKNNNQQHADDNNYVNATDANQKKVCDSYITRVWTPKSTLNRNNKKIVFIFAFSIISLILITLLLSLPKLISGFENVLILLVYFAIFHTIVVFSQVLNNFELHTSFKNFYW